MRNKSLCRRIPNFKIFSSLGKNLGREKYLLWTICLLRVKITTMLTVRVCKNPKISETRPEIFGFSDVWPEKPEILLSETRPDPDPNFRVWVFSRVFGYTMLHTLPTVRGVKFLSRNFCCCFFCYCYRHCCCSTPRFLRISSQWAAAVVVVAVEVDAAVGARALASRSALRSSQLFFFFFTSILHTMYI